MITSASDIQTIHLYNITGQLINTIDKNLTNTTRINIHTSGIYMVVVIANNTKTVQKIIIK